jgi:hypothetical protein
MIVYIVQRRYEHESTGTAVKAFTRYVAADRFAKQQAKTQVGEFYEVDECELADE